MEKKSKILIFAGTTEGRELAEFLSGREFPVEVSVATEYGETLLSPGPFLKIHQGRMEEAEMEAFFREEEIRTVVDATHPYAVVVSENIRQACEHTETEYIRLLREESSDTADCIFVEDTAGAVEYLKQTEGNVLLTTGSKELKAFTALPDFEKRLYARVLSTPEVAAMAASLGFVGKHLICMQGPFSRELNTAMLRQFEAAYLVTKDSGKVGGFEEKLLSAREAGAKVILIGRPKEPGTEGRSFPDVKKLLMERYSIPARRTIHLIGIGMGNLGTLTHDAAEAIKSAQIIFGADRLLKSVQEMGILSSGQPLVTEYIGTKILAYLEAHPQYRRIAVLMSGDVGFYSGARGIQEAFAGENVHFYCGISSVVYFASKIPTSWQDAKLLSAHGKQVNLLNSVQRYPKIIMIVSGAGDVMHLCAKLHEAKMDQVRVTVGTNLSYPEETVTSGAPEDFLTVTTTGLHIMMLENPEAKYIITPGMNDETFVRGKVPMTKEEIRILSVAKLQLTEDAIVYDVGAGTGSVSAECARLCTSGCVYAIERNPEGIELIRENAKQLKLSNLIPVEGLAPDAMEDLPVPTHAFIGGSAGNMGKIIDVLRAKNPDIRIVINTIALESISEVLGILKEREIDADIVQICASRSRTLGRYHMMTGQNPVYIISF